MTVNKTLFASAVLTLAGCASSIQLASNSVDAEAKLFEDTPQKGVIYIYMEPTGNVLAPAGELPISISGKVVSKIDVDTFVYAKVSPGIYTVGAHNIPSVIPVELEIKPGAITYLSFKWGWHSGDFREVDHLMGQQDILKRKAAHLYSKPSKDNRLNVRISH